SKIATEYHRNSNIYSSTTLSPHSCSASADDHVSIGVPPQFDETSPIGTFKKSYKYLPYNQHREEKSNITDFQSFGQVLICSRLDVVTILKESLIRLRPKLLCATKILARYTASIYPIYVFAHRL
uniref:Uncharacterized protein n=1 Tax=Ciona savignyi TaxID=51511 RepID=H2ZQA4_CIOSA